MTQSDGLSGARPEGDPAGELVTTLAGWVGAELITASQAAAIRDFERHRAVPSTPTSGTTRSTSVAVATPAAMPIPTTGGLGETERGRDDPNGSLYKMEVVPKRSHGHEKRYRATGKCNSEDHCRPYNCEDQQPFLAALVTHCHSS